MFKVKLKIILNLQKIIKESQSLEKIIEKQHKDNFEQMKKYIDEFYNLKLKARKLYEDIKFLKMRTEWVFLSSEREYYLTEASGTYFGNALTPIKNIISILISFIFYFLIFLFLDFSFSLILSLFLLILFLFKNSLAHFSEQNHFPFG